MGVVLSASHAHTSQIGYTDAVVEIIVTLTSEEVISITPERREEAALRRKEAILAQDLRANTVSIFGFLQTNNSNKRLLLSILVLLPVLITCI